MSSAAAGRWTPGGGSLQRWGGKWGAAFGIGTKAGTGVGVCRFAGLVARRIVPFVGDGDSLDAGQRIGLIRFGSRVDLYLPKDTEILGEVGQTAIAGETVLAVLSGESKGKA